MLYFRKILFTTILFFGLVALFFNGSAFAGADKAAITSLYEKAKVEGKVVIWGPQKRTLDWMEKPFETEFPGIDLVWAASLRSTTKILTEAKAGRHSLDVFHFSLTAGMIPLNKRKLLVKAPFEIFGTQKSNIWLDGKMGLTHNYAYALVYAEGKVNPKELPNTWKGFLDPKWKNKLLASSFLLPFAVAHLAIEWGEKDAADYLRALLNKQNILLTRQPRESILKSGERVVSLADLPSLRTRYIENGVPSGYKLLDVIPLIQFGVAAVKNAPHPNAAKLLAGWMTSEKAKRIREKRTSVADLMKTSSSPLAKKIHSSGATVITDIAARAPMRGKYTKVMRKIVSGRAK